jgi:hypothetical protein
MSSIVGETRRGIDMAKGYSDGSEQSGYKITSRKLTDKIDREKDKQKKRKHKLIDRLRCKPPQEDKDNG